MITRRNMMLTGAGVLTGAALSGGALTGGAQAAEPGAADAFVRMKNGGFVLRGAPYRYVGTNLWYGAYLAMTAAGRQRLCRELDRMTALGISNLRVLGASETSPLKNSMRPAIHGAPVDGAPGACDEKILRGLDFLLAEMARRDLRAVIFLNNFWEWSGGMVTYLYWTNGGHYINLGDPAHPWPEFADFSAGFYASKPANALYRAYVAGLIGRRNTVTGTLYRDDPAIMAWQLANEPRAGGSVEKTDFDAFYGWIADTADFIKRQDRNHLVSTGNEGIAGCLEKRDCAVRINRTAAIDYMTFHIWPLNWGWIDVKDMAGTFASCAGKTRKYVAEHLAIAAEVGKPVVAEEFGFPRDGGSFAPTAATTFRDRYYGLIFGLGEENARRGGAFAGSNFWSWGGEGRAQHADYHMRAGDTDYTGDPPQEPQGQNSVFDADETTIATIREHVNALKSI